MQCMTPLLPFQTKVICTHLPKMLCLFCGPTLLYMPGIEMEIVNSCEKNNGGCSHQCEHTTNGPLCSCHHGYQLDQDRKTCVGKNFFQPREPSVIYEILQCASAYLLQTVMSVSMGNPAAVTSAETIQAATNAAAEPATHKTQMAAAVMVRVLYFWRIISRLYVFVLWQ